MRYTTAGAVNHFRGLLEADNGLGASVEALKDAYGEQGAAIPDTEAVFLKAPPELHERSGALRYPVIHVYCERLESSDSERLRRMAGRMRLVTEVRVSQDRLEGITERLHLWVDALRDVLERNSGCAGGGMYLESGYEVTVDAVKKGGLHYLQSARIACWALMN
ncbi:MAG: hypothetical protein HY858_02435 [Candidatus Solibacter usitatus]|nr:hypothetical protein [Candidatus Solibacter usitatus]